MEISVGKRSISRRGLLKLGVGGMALGLLQGRAVAATTNTAGAPKHGGTFTLARAANMTNFNPYYLVQGQVPMLKALYNTVASYDMKLDLQPEVAERWDVPADGKSITLKLREGVKFHNGREMTAEDVKFSAEFARSDTSVIMRSLFMPIKNIEVLDKYRVRFGFDTLYAGVYDMLDSMYVIDKEEAVKDWAKGANGTGPFKVDKYVPNDRLEMVAFKDYWDTGKPYLDKYVMTVVPDAAALSLNLETGAVDCSFRTGYLDAVRLKGQGDKFVVDPGAPGGGFFDMALNVKAKPFDNKKVRQAIAWSIDRDRFCKTAIQGLVAPTCLMWPSHSWAYFKDLEGKIGYDLDRAKALLKEAGMEKGFETVMLTSSKRTFGYGDLAVILQADLKKIGVNAVIQDLEATQYDTKMNKGDIQMMVHTYGRANRDPGTLVTAAKAFYTDKEGGWCHFESAEYDKLRQELQSTLNRAKRVETCRKLQELVLDECFTISVAPMPSIWVYGKYVKNVVYNLDNAPHVSEFWLDR